MDKKIFAARNFVLGAALVAAGLGSAYAEDKVKVGLMLPYTGTYAALGNAITNGFKQFVEENGGKLGGREVEYAVVDDESNPAKATENARKLVSRDKVDVLVGTVHSGVALAMAKVARDSKTLMIVPNAGANDLTGPLCSPYVFRSSFSAWQPSYAMGEALAKKGVKTVATVTWKYSFGEESVAGFKEAFEKGGGKVVKDMTLPFPNVEFQPFLTEIASVKPDAVFVFFAGAGAAKFVSDYAAAGLKSSIPLYGPGFLTDGNLEAMGGAGEGLLTTLHYADGLNNAKDTAFRTKYAAAYKMQPDVYAVQGYDAAQMFDAGLKAAGGDPSRKEEVIKGMASATIDSPRGTFTLSKAHNPVQDIYMREVKGSENVVIEVVSKGLEDPARGCKGSSDLFRACKIRRS
jgi:branched-chain amino acid transport system substrate-binding protein